MAEGTIPDVSLSEGSDSVIPDVSLSTGSDSVIPDVSLSTGSEAVIDIECAPCNKDGHCKEAVRYCRDCREHLCGDCVRDHKNVRALKRHQLMDTAASDVKHIIKASHLTDINVRSEKNKRRVIWRLRINKHSCWITGMVAVDDDKVVAVDWNNDTIKLIDTTNNTILSEYDPESYPFDVTTCKDIIAVTLPSDSKIVFLKHTEGIVYDREISVNGSCHGIDWHDDNLYVVFAKQKKLEVMTPAGIVLQMFSTTDQGEQLFDHPEYVTVNAVNQRIYVSELGISRLVVLDMAGNQTGTCEDAGLLWQPKQLAVDGTGNMFLCDCAGDTVHLLSPAGDKLKILLTEQDGIVSPSAVCYCENTRRLYVGMVKNNTIKVYTVSKT